MRLTLNEIAVMLDGELIGDGDVVITGISGIEEAGPGEITFISNTKYLHLLALTGASAVIASRDINSAPCPIIRTQNPSLAFSKIVDLLTTEKIKHPKGIHKSAVIGKGAELGKNVALGPYVVVEEEARIGDNTIIYAGTYIGRKAALGRCVLIYPNVSIREGVVIGDRVLIHSGAVIGSDGFGFERDSGGYCKIPQIGTVVIEDDVEIGANVAIDRARFDKTVIGRGTKIDNLVQIAHNVCIGENSVIVAQAGISGSTRIGKNVIIAGQAGLSGHINIGDGAVIAAQAGVTKSVPGKVTVSGYPAQDHSEAKKINAYVQRLGHLYEKVAQMEKKIEALLKSSKRE